MEGREQRCAQPRKCHVHLLTKQYVIIFMWNNACLGQNLTTLYLEFGSSNKNLIGGENFQHLKSLKIFFLLFLNELYVIIIATSL